MRVLACLVLLLGTQAVERLRLADGPHGCAGRVEVWHGGRWGTVCDDGWDLRDAAVACQELGCGGALAAPGGAFFGEGTGPVWLSELACRGSEGQLGLCAHRGWKAHICSHEEDAGVVCAGQRVVSSRDEPAPPLPEGPWPGLPVEQSPSSEEPPMIPVPRLAGSPQNGPRKKSPRPKQIKSTRAPSLTVGAPRQERLRLVSGPHGCAGRLEVWHGGRWGTVCDDGWDLRDAAVACRELGCGGPLAAPGGSRFGPGVGPVWMDDVGCGGGEQALRDCPRSPWGRSNCDHSEDAGLVCTGPAPRLRLADGPHGCAGRLEVWHSGRWGTVCDDGWDLRDATVACRELGCGGALAAPGGAFFGEGAGPIILDDLRCRGNETNLRFCPARPWGQHDCHHREDAGAVCDGMPLGHVPPTAPTVDSSNSSVPSEAAPRPLPTAASQALATAGVAPPQPSPAGPQDPGPGAGSPQLRLVAGPSRCSGRLEVWHGGRWGTVCDDGWDLRDSAVVCRELGCGGPQQLDPTVGRFGWGAGPIWLDDVNCMGTELALTDCPAAPWGKHNCAHNEDVGVTCSGTPGLDTISDPFSWSWLPGLGRERDAWPPGGSVTKPTANRTPGVPEKPTTKAPGKTPKSTKKWVTKSARRPTPHPPVTPTTTASRAQHSSALPSATAAALQAQTTHTPAPTPQASAETPGWPAAPATATAASPTSPAGPFRLRLADGPNRCAGRLEVWHAGRWGTVCDDSWDLRDATVACRELGCGRVRPRVGKTHYGPGSGPIWLDDVGCAGGEASLSHCPAAPWGTHNCDHEEDVGLTCAGYPEDHDYPPWTWEAPSEEDRARGTSATAAPATTTRRPPDAGSPRRPGFKHWLLHPTPSPAPSASPGTLLTSATPDPEPTAEATSDPSVIPPPPTEPASSMGPDLVSTAPDLPWPTSASSATLGGTAEPPPTHTSLPTLPTELTSDRSAQADVSSLAPTSELIPELDTAPDISSTPYPRIDPEPPGPTDTPIPPPPTAPPQTPTGPHPTLPAVPTTAPAPTALQAASAPASTPPLGTSHPTALTAPTTPAPTSTLGTTKSPPTSLGTELPSPTPASAWPPSLAATPSPSLGAPTSHTQPPAASEPRPSAAPSVDPASLEDSKTQRSQSPKLTPPTAQTPHLTSEPSVTPPRPLPTAAHPLDLPPPDPHTLGPTPGPSPGPLGPCVAPVPAVRVMACEPPALVELVAAVRDMGGQLQKLTQVLEQERQERQAQWLGLTQLAEAAQGLGQLSEVLKRLVEVAWPPSTPVPTTTTPKEEERPLRGDV